MKVVLFCGGLGLRIKDHAENTPKPMITIGYRPILWHVMKYYAHYGHKDFILCLGYKSDAIKNYFVNYDECLSNDFILSQGCRKIELLNKDLQDWRITFVDTGLHSNIGQRLKAVEPHLQNDEVFMANYGDVLTDLPLPKHIKHFYQYNKVASFLCVKPTHTMHVASTNHDNVVTEYKEIGQSGIWINGGYFILRNEIFRYIHEGEELVYQPFQRLIEKGQLIAYKYTGFWASMDTFKEKQILEDMYSLGKAPWEVWKLSKKNDSR